MRLRAAGYMRLRAAGWELLATWGLSLAGFLLLCQGSKWLNGKSVWLVFVRSWVWISAGSWQFMHGFISHSLSRNTKYSWPPSVVYSKTTSSLWINCKLKRSRKNCSSSSYTAVSGELKQILVFMYPFKGILSNLLLIRYVSLFCIRCAYWQLSPYT